MLEDRSTGVSLFGAFALAAFLGACGTSLTPADVLGGDAVNPWFPLEPGTRWTYRQDSVTSRQAVTADVLTFCVQSTPPSKDSVTTSCTTPAPLAPGASV